MEENYKKPRLSFKGFTEAWEQRKLLDSIQKITDFRGRTPKKLGMDWGESGYLALSALNVKDGYIDFTQDVHYGDQALYDKWMAGNELHQGQVLFTTEAPMGNVAQIPDNRRYILSQRTIAFDVDLRIITEDFLATVLRTPAVFATLTSLSSGGTAKGVSQKSLATVDITIPTSLEEQNHLASFFGGLDNLITLHQRKYKKLVVTKKALFEKMFPKEANDVPLLRFKGYESAWQKKTLGQIGTTYTGLSGKTKEDFGHGKASYITYMNVFKNPIAKVDGVDFVEIDATQNVVKSGDVLFTTSSETPEEVGMASVWLGDTQNTYLNSFCFGYRLFSSEKIDPLYLAYLLRSPEIRKGFQFLAQGISRYNISKTKVMDIVISVPEDYEEQVKIGKLFFNLDKLIELTQKKYEKLENLKKAMLNKMFV
ncbi:MAG: restriction endonuclease subunit S [Candidatus Coproplasma sp.]